MAPDVLSELGANIIPIGVEPNGLNINLDCGSTSLDALRSKVLETGADLGVAYDGDGDRLMMVDHQGEVVDGDELIFIIAKNLHDRDGLKGGVVGTLMTNYGFELAMKDLGVDFCRANVGDRYVMAQLKDRGWVVGGESSGHILCLDKTSTGDGIVSSLQVLSALVQSGKTLSEMKKGMVKLPQTMINVRLPEKRDVLGEERVKAAIADAEAVLQDRGRVLLRASGTEPLIRVMVEGDNASEVELLAQKIADVVQDVVAFS